MNAIVKKSLTPDEENAVLSLLEDSFGCEVSSDFCLSSVVSSIWVENSESVLCGVALIESQFNQNYLSKFAVRPTMRGDGIAKLMWESLCESYSSFFWRAKSENPFSTWYERHADGCIHNEKWSIFWHGIEGKQINDVVNYAEMRPMDFIY